MIECEFKPNLLLVQAAGEVTMEEVRSQATRIKTHPLYDPLLDLMLDLRRVESLELDASQLREIVIAESIAGYQRKVAITASGDHVYGLARMFQSMAIDLKSEFSVFRDYFSGLAWLLQKGKYSAFELEKMRRRNRNS